MKNYSRLVSRVAAGAILVSGLHGAAYSATKTLALNPNSTLVLYGDSTLHPFHASATSMTVTVAVDPAKAAEVSTQPDFVKAVLQPGVLQKMELVIPVMALKSKDKALDKNMYKAMKADKFANIAFRLSAYEVTPSTTSRVASHVKATGTLEISGETNPIELEMETTPVGNTLKVLGQYGLLMSDYGIKPPTMMMGAIKVRDPVVIRFDLTLDAKTIE
jgi:hypothetical protein